MGKGDKDRTLGDPKPMRTKLTKAEYDALRVQIYNLQSESCKICFRWCSLEDGEFCLHHIKHRWHGDDSVENCIGVCAECHSKIHMGLVNV